MFSTHLAGVIDFSALIRERHRVAEKFKGIVHAPYRLESMQQQTWTQTSEGGLSFPPSPPKHEENLSPWLIDVDVNKERDFHEGEVPPVIFISRGRKTSWKKDEVKEEILTGTKEVKSHAFCLLPYHKIALDFHDTHFSKSFPAARTLLGNLGYFVYECNGCFVKDYPNYQLDNISFEYLGGDIISATRHPFSSARAFDARAVYIVQTLAEHLPDKEALFSFVPYNVRERDEESGPYRIEDLPTWISKVASQKQRKTTDASLSQIKQGILEQRCKKLKEDQALGITSLVCVKNELYHLPLLDFCNGRVPLEGALNSLSMPGMIVVSGNSWHFYGFTFMKDDAWKEFMKQSYQLYGIDSTFLEISEKRGYATLRLTPSQNKPFQPCLAQLHYP